MFRHFLDSFLSLYKFISRKFICRIYAIRFGTTGDGRDAVQEFRHTELMQNNQKTKYNLQHYINFIAYCLSVVNLRFQAQISKIKKSFSLY